MAGEPTDAEVMERIQAAVGPGASITPEAAATLAQSVGGNAALIQALQGGLSQLVGSSSGFIESLPAKVRRRIAYLQELQDQHDELEEQFDEELEALEKKYRELYAPLYSERSSIVRGSKEAPPAADGVEIKEEGGEDAAVKEEGVDVEKEEGEEAQEVPPGVPEFWLNVLRNYEDIGEKITEKDEAVLAYLADITEEELEGDDEAGFRLTFHFAKNEFFSNETLTKTYYMVPDESNVLEKAEGTKIEWAAGKNPTVKVLKKKPKKGAKPGTKPLTKLEPVESFFNFFSPPEVPPPGAELAEEDVEELQQLMEDDYETGEVIREKLIPNAVSWYTGDAIAEDFDDEDDDDDEDEDDEEEEEDEDDDDEDDEDEDEDEAPDGKPLAGATDSKEQPAECKQQ